MDNNASLDLEIARQCAPVLAECEIIQPADSGKTAKAPKRHSFENRISTYLLPGDREKAIWLVYRREELEDILFAEESQAFLKSGDMKEWIWNRC